jgi:hypothetical protein
MNQSSPETDFDAQPRFVNCEVCGTEGRLLTNDGGPDDVDHGPCPICNGDRVVEVETLPVDMDDIENDANDFWARGEHMIGVTK